MFCCTVFINNILQFTTPPTQIIDKLLTHWEIIDNYSIAVYIFSKFQDQTFNSFVITLISMITNH